MPEFTQTFPLGLEFTPVPVNITEAEGTVDVLVLSEASLPAGTYTVTISLAIAFGAANDQFRWGLIGDITSGPYMQEAKDGTEVLPRTHSFPITHAGGPLTTTLQCSITGAGAAAVTLNFANVWVHRVA